MLKKFNFIFIHGWAFDKKFWFPLKKRLEKDLKTKSIESIDLNYFSRKKYDVTISKYESKKNIFIVHSYGFNWFLKNKINDCGGVINFFGSPSFMYFQKNPVLIEKKINKMLANFQTNYSKVIKNFYRLCDIKFQKKTYVNINRLNKSLLELKHNEQSNDINNVNYKIFSIYSLGDKVFNVDKDKIIRLRNQNHKISFIKNFGHGFPYNYPDDCYKVVKKQLENF